jgi:hypothetical protein
MTKKQWRKPEVKRIEAGSAGGPTNKSKIGDGVAAKS